MPLEREKQGMSLKEYKSKLSNEMYSLRIGEEVPEGDVNLAYIHTPKAQSDENISLIDTSYTSDNVIPQEQLESIVVANRQGELEYVDIIGNGEVRPRPPKGIFPSDKIHLTKKFKKNEIRTENALYYKFEIDYHYDSQKASPNENGDYQIEKYSGQQIELTDENGNLLDDTYKYDIFVVPQAFNPHIYSVHIYLHKNTNKTDTIKVRYNHIDRVVKDEHVQSVQKEIELYTNRDNGITVDNQAKQMLEGGKLRVINGASAFTQKAETEVIKELEKGSGQEIFAVVPKENGEGYKIIVTQRSESDPRVPTIFAHRVIAEYKDHMGQKVKVSVGHITDWCINPDALIKSEREEYSGEWKNIGMPAGGGKLNAKEMIELALPFGTPSIPSDAKFYIEDDKGNLMYHVTNLVDNPYVDTQINEIMSKTVEAKANESNQSPWHNAMEDNTVIKNNPIPHMCSVIPERQQTKWDFTWMINGEGYTEKTTNYKTNWQVCANVGFKKSINPNTLDLLDKTKWSTIGNASDVNKWQYSYVPEMSKNVIEYLENADDVMGFYQRKEMIDGSMTDLMTKSDYQFSVKVRLTDPVDDDAIGLLFRVRDPQNYYMFIWEKNEISIENKKYPFDHGEGIAGTTAGCDRVILNEYGYNAFRYDPDGKAEETWKWTNNKSKYLQMGFGNRHKRILRATPSTLPPFSGTDHKLWNKTTRYPADKTNCEFQDITNFSQSYNAKGWEYGKDYKITVVVTGDLFRVYINENVDSQDLGQLVCQGTDNTHQRGSYGIFCLSQRWTYWYDLNMTEIIMDTVCTEKKDVILTDTKERKLSNYTVTDILEPLIKKHAKDNHHDAPYEVFEYMPRSSGEFTFRIDSITDFLYGRTTNPAAGAIVRTPWKTDDNGLTVQGQGHVEYHADGHYTITTNPNVLPSDQVPDDVLGFKWNDPKIISGENVTISLDPPNKVKVKATVPPIRIVGKPYMLNESEILKSEGLKHMEYLFEIKDEEGFYNQFEIPKDIPKEELLLRIERGKVTGISGSGVATVENPEYRVNYRFRCQKDGFTRLPVDQFQDQLGVNRLRLKSIMTKEGEFDPEIITDIVAWTTFQDLEAVPLFAIKIEEERKIQIEKPKIEHRKMEVDNWYLRIKSGRFLKRITLPYYEVASTEKLPEIYIAYPQLLGMVEKPEDIVEVDLEYSLPEYTNQEFYNRPFVLIDKEAPIILNEYALQTRYSPLVLESDTGVSYLEVYSVHANQKRHLRVSDVDAAKGIIYLLDRIREQDDIYIRYAYKEEWYTYRGFEKDKEFFHLDLNPTQGHRYTIAANGFHHWIPTDKDKESFVPKDVYSTELLAKQIHVYLRPKVIRYVDHVNPSRHGNPIPGTMKTKVLYHTDEEWWFNEKDYKYDPTMLRLGKVMLQANSQANENMTILDTRTRGGGLDESLSREIISQINKESLYHWDIGYFDGEAYQENGVIIIRVPQSILKSDDNPNGFHESEVQAAVAKHEAYGILPIIEYYSTENDEKQYNIIPNHSFFNGKHIGYYDPSKSSGKYEIVKIKPDTPNDYVLKLTDQSIYAITIPGYRFKSNQYQIDIKAMKEHISTDRSAGLVEIHYKNGTSKEIQLGNINRNQWTVYKELIDVNDHIRYITIYLNKTDTERKGAVIYDYVLLTPVAHFDEASVEIHDI